MAAPIESLQALSALAEEAPCNAAVRAWKEGGGKVIGYLCTYVPEELLYAAGLLPVRMSGCSEEMTGADAYLYANTCFFARSCLQTAEAYREIMRQAYGEHFLKTVDILGRQDFYGIVAEEGVKFCAEKLGLSADSHVLELCSGIGGPARFMARTYGCRVTGIDINEFSCQVAAERTRRVGLEQRVDFHCGNALEIPFPEASFTHVFGCDAWSYMPDKVALYRAAWRVLKPGGVIAFLDTAQNGPKAQKSHWEEIWGSYHPESLPSYASLLETAGFQGVCHHDTTELATRETLVLLNRLIK